MGGLGIARSARAGRWIGGLVVVAAACVTGPQDQDGGSKASLSDAETKKVEELRQEVEIGRNMAGRLLAAFDVYDDPNLLGYVNQVATFVAGYSDYPDRRYMVQVLKSDMVNAFACPGGYILVTSGAIALADSEAELAMILGHEVAHVGKRHMFDTLKNMSKDELDKAAEESKKTAELPETVKVRDRVKADDESALGSEVARYLAGASGGLNILQAASAGMNVMLSKGLDKKLEYEADQEGVKYAIRAGYDPGAMLKFLKRLASKREALKLKALEGTHPKVEDRLERVRGQVNTMFGGMNPEEVVGARGKERFAQYTAKLPQPKASDKKAGESKKGSSAK